MAEAKASYSSKLGRVVDYLLGRNTLIGVASFMLLIISGYATWHGMRDFIIGASSSSATQDLPGGQSISSDILVIAVVVALTFLMWLTLRETFGAGRSLRERLITFPLYVFLAIWSIGFGYGFWWSLISGEEATRTGLAGLQEDARDASAVIAARLDAVRAQLDSVMSWSESQMAREETSGGSCGTASGAGRGPLYNARVGVRDAIVTMRDSMVRSWLEPVQAEVEHLRETAAAIGGSTIEERQRAFEQRASEIRGRARSIAARSNQLGRSTAAEMRALANAVAIPPGQPGFSCYDPTLAERLRQAAAQAEQPAELKLREAVFSEGPAGVANAVKNLWTNIGTYARSLAIYVASGGKEAFAHTESGEPITGRDLIALLATIGIDMGLLALAILNPPRQPPSIRPSGALMRQINDAIEMAVARAPNADREWIRRHFLHHNKASYLVIPNLYSCDPNNPDEASKALAMNQLAGVLSDLDLVRWPKRGRWWLFEKDELQRLKKEESLGSDTDLTEVRKAWLDKVGKADQESVSANDDLIRRATPLRNHGLFSKAERALQIAGWSERARSDIEIFRLVDTEGLTPLLMVLNAGDPPRTPNIESGSEISSGA
ncbi:MAG TPA: hypothetical protein VF226_05400 [Hyphomicrobiaceae bacterium]